jgi:hypothetical protein
MTHDIVLAVGWLMPKGKPTNLMIFYCGDDVLAAEDVLNDALDSKAISFGRIFRGAGFGGGQLMWAGTGSNRPQLAGPVFPPGSK